MIRLLRLVLNKLKAARIEKEIDKQRFKDEYLFPEQHDKTD